MSDWLSRVGNATHTHRETRARQYDRIASRRRNQSRLSGGSEFDAAANSLWHASRARGQRERIERVEACNTEVRVIRCQSCGLEHERESRSGCPLLCVRCRGSRARQTRIRFLAARASVLKEAWERGLMNPQRRGGRWGERLLTLTAPQLDADTVELGSCAFSKHGTGSFAHSRHTNARRHCHPWRGSVCSSGHQQPTDSDTRTFIFGCFPRTWTGKCFSNGGRKPCHARTQALPMRVPFSTSAQPDMASNKSS